MKKYLIKNDEAIKINILTIVIFTFLFTINLLFPVTGDDIIAINNNSLTTESILSNILYFGNGRFLGNLLFYIIRIPVLCALQKSLFWTGIIYFSSKLLDITSLFNYSILSLSFIYPCASVFSQAYTWSAGFQNYVSPVFFILLSLLLLKQYFEKNKLICGVLSCLPLFVSQFFSENTSIFTFLFFAVSTILFFIKNKKINFVLILDTFISATGFGLMMLLPNIFNVADKMDSYRNVSLSLSSIIRTAIYNYRSFADCMISCFLLWIILSISLLILKKNIFSNKVVDTGLSVILIATPCYSMMYDFFIKEFVTPDFHIKTILNIGLFTAYILSVALIYIKSYLLTKEKYIFSSGLFFAMGLVSFAPLLIVTPIGARTFYLPYICFILSAFILTVNNTVEITKNRNVAIASVLSVISVLTALTFTFYDVKSSEIIRNNYLEEEIAAGNQNITIPLLPHQELIHEDDSRTHWGYYFNFKDAYPDFDFAPFESWIVEKTTEQ